MSPRRPGRRLQLALFAALIGMASLCLPAALFAQYLSVYPHGGSLTEPWNTNQLTTSFGVNGTQSGTYYYVEVACSGQVTSCASSVGQSFMGPISSITVTYNTLGQGTGRIRLWVYEGGYSPSDSGWDNVTVNETIPPTTALMQPSPTTVTTQHPTIQVGWCDNLSLNASSRYIKVNGTDVTASFDYNTSTGPSSCSTTKASSTTSSVALNIGNNTVEAHICDNSSNCVTNDYTIRDSDVVAPTISLTLPSPTTVFTPTPQIQLKWCDDESLNASTRSITLNGTNVTSSFDYVTGASGCAVAATSTSSSVTLNVGANTLQGHICDNWNNCTTQNFTITRELPAGVVLFDHNRDNLDRSLCLNVAAGDAAEVQCGDLVAYHAMPAFKTMNTPRTLTLVYNSASADPRPRVAAQVTLGTSDQPQSVFAKLIINGATRDSAIYSSWTAGATRQLSLAFDASDLATGAYPFNLLVRLNYSGASHDTTLTDTLLVVNRRASDFGSGWYLSGVESLVLSQPGGSILWVGGDGSARLYRNVGSGVWQAPPGTKRDSIFLVGSNYERRGKNGLKVTFDGAGRHIQTTNRLGHVTTFNWVNGKLASIVLPPLSSTYQIAYDASGKLDKITDPGNRILDATVSSGLVTQLTDPDSQSVSFGYDAQQRLTSRTNRRLAVTHYYFDNGLRVTKFQVPLSTQSDLATTTFTNWDEFDLALNSPGGTLTPADPSTVRTIVDGPRPTTVGDTTVFRLDRFGAPDTVVNALGQRTVILRGDTNWPALPTQVTGPDGFATQATYDTRGNLATETGINPLGDNVNAVTHYYWNSKWDFSDSTVSPTGVVTSFGYDAINGNRVWEQVGHDQSRRVSFNYANGDSLLSSVVLPQGLKDSAEYDSQGNLAATRTPKGFWTSYYNDAFGRDTAVVTPIDSTDTGRGGSADNTARMRQRTVYTTMGQEWVTQSVAPNSAEQVQVTKLYDAEGNLKSLARISNPDVAGVGTITTQWRYDLANRKVAEVAPDNEVDSTAYDSAGNVVTDVTRRKDPTTGNRYTISMTYDALNRLTTKHLDAVTYPSRTSGLTVTSPWNETTYAAYSIAAETDSFTYDPAGRLLTADNPNALIKRTYYPGGLLQTDSLRIQTVGQNNWNTHIYGLRHTYDHDGRETVLAVPHQLGVGADSTLTQSYDSDLGLLQTMHDLQQNAYSLYYDLRGDVDSIAYPGAYSEALRYDVDGRLTGDTIWNDSVQTYPRVIGPNVRATASAYDARGKLLWSGDAVRYMDTLSVSYTGLGNLKSALWLQHGCASCDLTTGWRSATSEDHTQDALANQTLRSIRTELDSLPNWSVPPESDDTLHYQSGTGRLTQISFYNGTSPQPPFTYSYDSAGDQEFLSAVAANTNQPATERASYFAADGGLRKVDSRWAAAWDAQTGYEQKYVVEEYRYDALGRRVWVRSSRRCDDYTMDYRTATECRVGFVRRTIWNGSQELAEIQSPWGLEGIRAQFDVDTTTYAALADSDVTPLNLPQIWTSGSYGGDPNKLFGYVVYGAFLGLDHPLAITRVNYAWIMDWNYPGSTLQSPAKVQPLFTIVPFWNAQGDAQQGVFSTGEYALCNPSTSQSQCVALQWPWEKSSTDRQEGLTRAWWHGTLIESKRDKSGFGYSRNRYYDPATGRFTQEDPIGLAGGLNVYGFGAGDPINDGDPFGLCPKDVGGDGKTQSVDDCPQDVQDAWEKKHIHITAKGGTDWNGVDPALRSAIVRTSMLYRMDFGISGGKELGHSVEGRHAVGGAADINQANGIRFGAMTDAAAVAVGNAIGGAIANRIPYGRNLMIYAPGMAFRLNRPMSPEQYRALLIQHRTHVHASIAPENDEP